MIEKEKEKFGKVVDFWEGVKVRKPIEQFNEVNASASAEGEENRQYMEFCCKCVRRAMEQPDTNLEELAEILDSKIKTAPESTEGVLKILENRLSNLDQDIVVKQRHRFEMLENKVKTMLEQKALSDGSGQVQVTAKQLKQIMAETEEGIKQEQMNNRQGSTQMLQFKNAEEKSKMSYEFLWLSEKFYLQGICAFVTYAQTSPPRNINNLAMPLNCIFDDVIRLDFTKFKAALFEYQESEKERIAKSRQKSRAATPAEDGKPGTSLSQNKEEEEEVSPDKRRLDTMTTFLEVMAKAAKFALNSRSWLQLMSIILYVWNTFAYDLANPLELTRTEAWKSVVVLAECSLFLLEYLQGGGKLRTLAGQDIDMVANQKPIFGKDGNRTVAFKFDQDSEDEEAKEAPQTAIQSASTNLA